MDDLISRQATIDAIVGKRATGNLQVKCSSCGHRIAERPFEVYCNIMCKWVNEKDYCTMFEPGHMGTSVREVKRMANIIAPIQVNMPDDWIEQIVNRLRNDPESEWAEIIRCKDCRHNGSFDTDCPIDRKGKEYCSFAERREE